MRRNHIAVMGIVTTDTTAAIENLRQSLAVDVAAVSAIATVCPLAVMFGRYGSSHVTNASTASAASFGASSLVSRRRS